MPKKLILILYLFLVVTIPVLGEGQKNIIETKRLVFVRGIHLDQKGMLFKGYPIFGFDKQGNLFAASNWYHVFYKFNPALDKVECFARKGQGPGDLERPYDLRIEGENIILLDNTAISFFSR